MDLRGWKRFLLVWLATAMALAPLGGCETTPAAKSIHLAGIVIDGARLARPDEAAYAVRVTRGGAPIAVSVGMPLQRGDRIATASNAYAVVRWPSGSEVYMRPGSSAEIASLTRAIGTFFVKVRGLFAVETEFVKSGAQGTAFLVRSEPGGAVTVTVFDGKVQVDSRLQLWRPVVMQAGQTGVAHPAAPQPRPATPAEMEQTREWVERIEKLVPARGGYGWLGPVVAIGALISAILLVRGSKKSDSPPPIGTRPN